VGLYFRKRCHEGVFYMTEEKRHGLEIAGLVFLFLVYFFGFAQALNLELVLNPTWVTTISEQNEFLPNTSKSTPIPFALGSYYGYFATDGKLLNAKQIDSGIAISDDAFVSYPKTPDSLSILSPSNSLLGSVPTRAYPYFDKGRLFFIQEDKSGVFETTLSGQKIFQKDFSSIITAFNTNTTVSAVGLLEGKLEILDEKGAVISTFSPGGSRLPVILGTAVSPNSNFVAAISGVDPERLLVLSKRKTGYQVLFHELLPSNFRRPVQLAFSSDSAYLFYEQENTICILDLEKRTTQRFVYSGNLKTLSVNKENDLIFILSGNSNTANISAFKAPGAKLLATTIHGSEFYLRQKDNSIYIGVDSKILRIDAKEM